MDVFIPSHDRVHGNLPNGYLTRMFSTGLGSYQRFPVQLQLSEKHARPTPVSGSDEDILSSRPILRATVATEDLCFALAHSFAHIARCEFRASMGLPR